LHAPFPLPGRLVGIFRPIVQIAVPVVFHSRHYLALGGLIALQFVSDDDSGHVRQVFEQRTEEFLRCRLVPPALI
jgi:hypothetical protein